MDACAPRFSHDRASAAATEQHGSMAAAPAVASTTLRRALDDAGAVAVFALGLVAAVCELVGVCIVLVCDDAMMMCA